MTSRTLSADKIIRTAMDLITDQVPLSFTNLSKRLGTRSQALYNYFPDVGAVSTSVANQYNQDLAARLQSSLLGLSGQDAILHLAIETRNFALHNFKVTQFVLAIPREKLNENDQLSKSSAQLRDILYQLLETMGLEGKMKLNASRLIRNLIIGEIVNVGRGWFTNSTVEETDSFERMLRIGLAHLAEL